ncbi:MAG: GNAT family N-acetyltransferase [Acidimicrobiia bacterium]|nr:GNAT family N-acetyltransferase [Acidimicrobiia bacterium]
MDFVSARPATSADVPALARLYRALEEEMTALSALWPLADGVADPVEESMFDLIGQDNTVGVVGEIDGVPVGFLFARIEPMLPRANGKTIGAIRLVFVDHEAREVGVGEAMLEAALEALRSRGVSVFDAHVLPGHRLVKNFFESGGFKARSIVMSRTEDA